MLKEIVGLLNVRFTEMNDNLAQIGYQINNLDKTIINAHFWTALRPSLSKLSSANTRLKNYFNVTNANYRLARMERLGTQWDIIFEAVNDFTSVFRGIYSSQELCISLLENLSGDRVKVMRQFIGLFIRLVEGVQDLVYVAAIQEHADLPKTIEEQTIMLMEVQEIFSVCDKEIEEHRWKKYFKDDVDIILMGDS